MIDFGAGPRVDELEVVVFGPGFGECVLVHFGDGQWMAVDSCLGPDQRPIALTYLQQVHAAPDALKIILASHWHDDHVRGISELARNYPGAEFHMSSVFNNKEALAFLAAHSSSTSGRLSRGCDELFTVVSERTMVRFDHQRSTLFHSNVGGRTVAVTAFSPVPAALGQMIATFASNLPSPAGGSPIRNAVGSKPNLEAVAVHIDIGGSAILLGSDLENHANLGWAGVLSDAYCAQKERSSVYKIAHHGSHSGEHEQIWADLLTPNVQAVATPFSLGRHRLPTDADRVRIRARTGGALLTSASSAKARIAPAQLKRLNQLASNVAPINTGFGAVRLRKAPGAPAWTSELFGDAAAL
jgi:beta-lactamase superfamily II metal-dependent hydrolase